MMIIVIKKVFPLNNKNSISLKVSVHLLSLSVQRTQLLCSLEIFSRAMYLLEYS